VRGRKEKEGGERDEDETDSTAAAVKTAWPHGDYDLKSFCNFVC